MGSNMNIYKIIISCLIIILLFFAFIMIFISPGYRVKMDLKRIKKLISENLKPGDSSEKIEIFLKSQGISFTFDKLSQRYQCSYPNKRYGIALFSRTSIWILINVDKSSAFASADVQIIGSGL